MNEIQKINKEEKNIQSIKSAAWMTLSEESQKAYKSDFKMFFEFIQKNPKDIDANDIVEYIYFLEKKNYKNATINRKIASLSKMFRVMVIAGEIKTNPIETLKQFKKISRKVSKEVNVDVSMKDIKKAVRITKKTKETEKKTILIIRTLASTGLRISELINIQYKDIYDYDEDNKRIRIIGKGRKERFIFLQKYLYDEILSVFQKVDNIKYLFYNNIGNKYNRSNLYKQIVKYLKEKTGKHIRPHMLRHIFITYKIVTEKKDIKSVSKYAGHSSVQTTLDLYTNSKLDSEDAKVII